MYVFLSSCLSVYPAVCLSVEPSVCILCCMSFCRAVCLYITVCSLLVCVIEQSCTTRFIKFAYAWHSIVEKKCQIKCIILGRKFQFRKILYKVNVPKIRSNCYTYEAAISCGGSENRKQIKCIFNVNRSQIYDSC